MVRTVVFGVGFDEKLVLRAWFRIGLKTDDVVLLAYSMGGGEYEKNRVSRALETVRSILSSAGVYVREVDLEARDFGRDVASLFKALEEIKPREVIIALGSGMRYLGLVFLYTALIYRELVEKRVEVSIYAAREDGLYDVLLNAKTLRLGISRSELLALKYIKPPRPRDILVKELGSVMNKSISTIYMLIDRMEKKGLVRIVDNKVELTPLGEALYHSTHGEKSE